MQDTVSNIQAADLQPNGEAPAAGGKLRISVGKSRNSKDWKVQAWTWEQLRERLARCKYTAETVAEYQAMSKEDRGRAKDIGGFVGGALKADGRRLAENMADRCLVTLDIDFGQPGTLARVRAALNGFAWCVYTTHSHTVEVPRYRVVLPLSRPVTPEEYVPLARAVADKINIEEFDGTTYEPSRLMYWPSAPKDGAFDYQEGQGEWLDADYLLRAYYVDWRDATEWPRSSRENPDTVTRAKAKRMEDPRGKDGIVGAFCRVYNIYDALAYLIPGVYTPTDSPERFTFKDGSTTGGLKVYDNGLFAMNFHDSNIAIGDREVNAFDLVRLHKFGDTAESWGQMMDFCRTLPEVWDLFMRECEAKRPRTTAFDEFGPEVAAEAAPQGETATPGEGAAPGVPVPVYQMNQRNARARTLAAQIARGVTGGQDIEDLGRPLAELAELQRGTQREDWSEQLGRTAEDIRTLVRQRPAAIKSKWAIGFWNQTRREMTGRRLIDYSAASVEIFAAHTSHGKTTFLLQAATDLLEQDETAAALYVCCEENEQQLWERLYRLYVDLPETQSGREKDGGYCFKTGARRGTAIWAALNGADICEGYNTPEDLFSGQAYDFGKLRERILAKISDFERRILPRIRIVRTEGSAESIVDNIKASVKAMRDQGRNVKAVFLDYVQKLTLESRNYDRTNELKAICGSLKHCAETNKLPLVIAAQFNRSGNKEGIDSVTLANLGESKEIENIANNLYMIWYIDKTKVDEYFSEVRGKKASEAEKKRAQQEGREAKDTPQHTTKTFNAWGDRSRRIFAHKGRIYVLKGGCMYVEVLKSRNNTAGAWGIFPFDEERGYIGENDGTYMQPWPYVDGKAWTRLEKLLKLHGEWLKLLGAGDEDDEMYSSSSENVAIVNGDPDDPDDGEESTTWAEKTAAFEAAGKADEAKTVDPVEAWETRKKES